MDFAIASPADFPALSAGRFTLDTGTGPCTLSVHDLGTLLVPSGHLLACDPFVQLPDGLVTDVPPGRYPVRLTVADVSPEQDGSHLREAYLSLVLAEGVAARGFDVVPPGRKPGEEAGSFYGIPVDAGTVCLVDAEAALTCMPSDGGDWLQDLFECPGGWFDRLDDPTHLRAGAADIPLPLGRAGENLILTHSGWGDGLYPLVRTLDADGHLLAVHIDLFVADDVYDRQDEEE